MSAFISGSVSQISEYSAITLRGQCGDMCVTLQVQESEKKLGSSEVEEVEFAGKSDQTVFCVHPSSVIGMSVQRPETACDASDPPLVSHRLS